jgi:hypothetical protein
MEDGFRMSAESRQMIPMNGPHFEIETPDPSAPITRWAFYQATIESSNALCQRMD